MTEKRIPWLRALVEGTVIVGSILLALALDAWWDGVQERQEERGHLTALLSEFEDNALVLQQAHATYHQHYSDAARLLELIEDDLSVDEAAEFDRLLSAVLHNQTFHLESGAFDGLMASGGVDVIRDQRLRNRLAAWPSHLAEWTEEVDAIFSLVGSEIVPHLAQLTRLRSVAPPFADFPDGEPPPRIPSLPQTAASRTLLANSMAFENLIHRRAQASWYALRDGETLQVQLSEIIQLLDAGLNE